MRHTLLLGSRQYFRWKHEYDKANSGNVNKYLRGVGVSIETCMHCICAHSEASAMSVVDWQTF